jgi:phosphoribosylanthranilate isomerase
MTGGIHVKICGLTSPADAHASVALGADFLGINLHPQSPRYVPLARFRSMAAEFPDGPRVAVMVEPRRGDLPAVRDAGFGLFQVHFRHDIPLASIEEWSREVGADALWLAPKLPPGIDVPADWLGLAGCFLIDTFDKALFGGTGRTGDWPKFRRHREAHPDRTWILSGGLNPSNVGEAITGTGARFVDVTTGVESTPGTKDHAKLKAFFGAVRASASR